MEIKKGSLGINNKKSDRCVHFKIQDQNSRTQLFHLYHRILIKYFTHFTDLEEFKSQTGKKISLNTSKLDNIFSIIQKWDVLPTSLMTSSTMKFL